MSTTHGQRVQSAGKTLQNMRVNEVQNCPIMFKGEWWTGVGIIQGDIQSFLIMAVVSSLNI